MRYDKPKFQLFVFAMSFVVLHIGCGKSLPNPKQIGNANDEAVAFRSISSDHHTYEIKFFDSRSRQIRYSPTNLSVLKSVVRIEVKVPSGKVESYAIFDVKNLELLLGE